MDAVPVVVSRWLHIVAMSILVGGVLYARFVLSPAMQAMPADARQQLSDRLAAGFRPWIYLAVAAVLASGLYNLLTKPALPPGYHMVFGIKMLLALHIFAVALLLGKSGVAEGKRARQMTGIAISGIVVLLLSAYLRWMSQV